MQRQTLPPCSCSRYTSRNNTNYFQKKALLSVDRLNTIQVFEMAFLCGARPPLLRAPRLWLSYSASVGPLQTSFFQPKSPWCCRGQQAGGSSAREEQSVDCRGLFPSPLEDLTYRRDLLARYFGLQSKKNNSNSCFSLL